jgi:hypothetical protein
MNLPCPVRHLSCLEREMEQVLYALSITSNAVDISIKTCTMHRDDFTLYIYYCNIYAGHLQPNGEW